MKNIQFGDIYQYILTNGNKGSEVVVVCKTHDQPIERVYYYNFHINLIQSKPTRDFLEDYIFVRKYGKDDV